MRKILIVGAGQSGLHLAHGLLGHGYDVTVITGRTSTELRTGRPAISQLTFPTILEYERELHLDFWSAQAPHIEKMKLHLYPSGSPEPMAEFGGRLKGYAVSVDRRVKMADWLEYFEDRGGKVVIHGVTVSDLDYFSRMYDLVIIAVGYGELGGLFDLDPNRFSGARPRILAQALVDNAEPPDDSDGVDASIGSTADAGQAFYIPVLTAHGPCYSLFIVEKRGGVIDSWPRRISAAEQWRLMRDQLRRYAPRYYSWIKNASLIDARSATIEELSPQVRRPVGVLPMGGRVVGLADVVITADPSAAQTWNHSSRCAKSYLDSILAHGDRQFDEAFLAHMFDKYWEYGRFAELWSETVSSFWEAAPPEHFQEIFAAIAQYPEVADRWIQGWDNPRDYHDWLLDPVRTRTYLAEVAATYGR